MWHFVLDHRSSRRSAGAKERGDRDAAFDEPCGEQTNIVVNSSAAISLWLTASRASPQTLCAARDEVGTHQSTCLVRVIAEQCADLDAVTDR